MSLKLKKKILPCLLAASVLVGAGGNVFAARRINHLSHGLKNTVPGTFLNRTIPRPEIHLNYC
jgi:hypothetical protein